MRPIPTEPIGSIPRSPALLHALSRAADPIDDASLAPLYEQATLETIAAFESTGSPVVTDGEQRKYHNFATYAVHGADNFAPDGFSLPFTGHTRRLPRLTRGPFRYRQSAATFLREAKRLTERPLKQAVIAPSALSLMYPENDLPGYTREQFLYDVLEEHAREVRECLDLGADTVQVDFTEGRLSLKLDPSGALLNSFITLNNMALSRFPAETRPRIGIHTCPGGDRDSTHSADIDYAELLPSLFELQAGRFYVALAREPDQRRVLSLIHRFRKPWQHVFVGVIDVLDPRIETAEEVRDRVLLAAEYIPVDHLGTTDDCGYSPFSDDESTSRETAFAKIRARVQGTALASEVLAS